MTYRDGQASSETSRLDLAVTIGDPAAFSALIEPYRSLLHLHCYRLLGSLQDAEDLVQETMLRAWQHRASFKGQASLRTWLYRIATNACLDVLKRRPRRTLPMTAAPAADPLLPLAPALAEQLWLEPFPDDGLVDSEQEPAARYARRESVSLAFLSVLQLLPPRQRAILLLSDVLDWRAREIALLLSISVSAVTSALHRARATLEKHYAAGVREQRTDGRADAATEALLERYLRAWETEDIAGLVALLKEDATFTMPPSPSWYRGRDAIRAVLGAQAFAPLVENRWQFYPTRANGCPAFAVYRATGSHGVARAFGIQLLTIEAGAADLRIADVTTFLVPSLLSHFGFPYEPPG
jgi:RNA polymerase sigma-70 factor, ECF subfamily